MQTSNFDWLRHWSWVILFGLITYIFYDQARKSKEREIVLMKRQLSFLEEDKDKLLSAKEDFLLRIDSQNDPTWVEQVLMKELGVVPNGYLKVYFKREPE